MYPLCLSRITDPAHARHFGDGRHKFYLEMRCPRPALPDRTICSKCVGIYAECKNQFCGLYPHGNVNEPIPDHSHMYGGRWYHEHVREWGEPTAELIALAQQYQEHARQDIVSKAPMPFVQEMDATKEIQSIAKPAASRAKPKPKPKEELKEELKEEPKEEPKKKAPKPKKPTVAPKEVPKEPPLRKEVVIPTHKETSLEEFDTDGYHIEYVSLSLFEHNHTTYLRDRKKNKLYRSMKNGVGPYIGRWDPDSESIVTDVPDSDQEEE